MSDKPQQQEKKVEKKQEQEVKQQEPDEQQLRREKFGPLVKYCRKNNLKEKDALWADQRIKFFRQDDFTVFMKEHLDKIKPLVKDFSFNGYDTDMYRFLKYLLDQKILARYERCDDSSSKKLKYPKRLLLNPVPFPGDPKTLVMDKCFYRFDYQEEQKNLKLYSYLMVLAIALICLFPVWPIIVKKIIFYISFYLLIALTGFTSLRIILFITFRAFGVEFWILPNFFDDTIPFLETFKPIMSVQMTRDGKLAYLFRALGFIALCLIYYYVWMQKDLIIEEGASIVNDVEKWGLDKFLKKDLPSRALPGYETFLDGEDDHNNNNTNQAI